MDTIEIDGTLFETNGSLVRRLGISRMTLRRWAKAGILPPPIRIGRFHYYERNAVHAGLIRSASK